MLAPPKSLVGFGATLLTLRMSRQLRRTTAARDDQARTWRTLVQTIGPTSFGRQHGLHKKITRAQWQERLPPRRYEHFVPYVERMQQGEENVLWPGRCEWFAMTSGTTGTPKVLPVTPALVQHFHQAGLHSLLHYTARVHDSGIFRGRHLFLGGSTEITAFPRGGWGTDITGLLAQHLPVWVAKHFYEPGTEIAKVPEWSARLEAILDRTRRRDITVIAGQPDWLLTLTQAALGREIERREKTSNLQELWPNLECIVHGGIPMAPYAEQLRQAAGPRVTFHEVYGATEGFCAAQEAESAGGLRLLTNVGLYFEFIPLADFETGRLDALGAKAVPLEGVHPKIDYVVLVTTPAGLCRYVLGDIVRFVSVQPPRLVCVGRTALQMNAMGEAVHERELTEALTSVCQRHHWRIVNFHVAPYFGLPGAPSTRGCHEWWIELKPGTMETPTGPVIAQELDGQLRRIAARYDAKRSAGTLEAPVARLVMPGVFEQWLRSVGKWGGPHKVPRCRSDRVLAEELSRLAPYSAH